MSHMDNLYAPSNQKRQNKTAHASHQVEMGSTIQAKSHRNDGSTDALQPKGATFMTIDISNFYLMPPLSRPKYIQIKITDLPDEIIEEYNLANKATKDGSIYIEVNKGMYVVP